MAKARDVLLHVIVERAKGKRKCRKSRGTHHIDKGEMCVVVRGTMKNDTKSYCLSCGAGILDAAQDKLDALQDALAGSAVDG